MHKETKNAQQCTMYSTQQEYTHSRERVVVWCYNMYVVVLCVYIHVYIQCTVYVCSLFSLCIFLFFLGAFLLTISAV